MNYIKFWKNGISKIYKQNYGNYETVCGTATKMWKDYTGGPNFCGFDFDMLFGVIQGH